MDTDKEKAEYEALNLFITARDKSGLSQTAIAQHFHVSLRAYGDWERGNSYPKAQEIYKDKDTEKETTRRALMIECLWDLFNLKKNHQQFHKIWRMLMVDVWNWANLTEEEKIEKNLDPPLELFLNVPPRPLNIPKVVGRKALLSEFERLIIQRPKDCFNW